MIKWYTNVCVAKMNEQLDYRDQPKMWDRYFLNSV